MKILVTGATGQIGSRFAAFASSDHQVVAAVRAPARFKNNLPSVRFDLTDDDSIREAVELTTPDIVIHFAALTSPEKADAEAAYCTRVNVEGTATLAASCVEVGTRLIYLSTDLVFDGTKGFYNEEDKPNPLNHYAMTKLEGEKAVYAIHPAPIVARTSIVFGYGLYQGGGFAKWLVENLRARKRVALFTDQFRSHLFLDDCVRALMLLAEKDVTGTFHLSTGQKESRYEFGMMLAKALDLDHSLIDETEMAKIPFHVKRPRDCSLDNSKLVRTTDFKPTPLDEALARLKEETFR